MGSLTIKPVVIAVTIALLAATNLAIWFPGESGPDSQSQYAQALAGQFDDWHPPIMARLWSILRLVADGDGSMFCFQLVGYWLGFGLIATALARAGRPRAYNQYISFHGANSSSHKAKKKSTQAPAYCHQVRASRRQRTTHGDFRTAHIAGGI